MALAARWVLTPCCNCEQGVTPRLTQVRAVHSIVFAPRHSEHKQAGITLHQAQTCLNKHSASKSTTSGPKAAAARSEGQKPHDARDHTTYNPAIVAPPQVRVLWLRPPWDGMGCERLCDT